MDESMDWRTAFRMAWRWSLLTTAVLTAFWVGWYAINGSVPTEHVTRWADIAIGPIWSCTGILIGTLVMREDQLMALGAVIWLLSLALALWAGIVSGLMLMAALVAFFGLLYLVVLAAWILLLAGSLLPGTKRLSRWLAGE